MRTRGQKIQSNEYDKKYGLALKSLRVLKKLNQTDIAKNIGITLLAYAKYEQGSTKVSISTENKIAQLYGMTRVEFVQNIENKINEQK